MTTPPPTLAEFLTARLDKLEAKAREAEKSDPAPWVIAEGWRRLARVENGEGHLLIGGDGVFTWEAAEFIAANDPATVLADIAIKRQLVALADEWDRLGREAEAYTNRAHASEIHEVMAEARWFPERAAELRAILASAFASHPDWREEWRP